MSGIYWGITPLHLLGQPDALPRAGLLDFVLSCLHPNGGFGAAPGHDPHMLYTVSAVQILATLDAFSELEEKIPGAKQRIGSCQHSPFACQYFIMSLTSHRYCKPTEIRKRHFRWR